MTIVKIRSYFFSNKTIKTERTFGQILKQEKQTTQLHPATVGIPMRTRSRGTT